jgi:hypothetical protein
MSVHLFFCRMSTIASATQTVNCNEIKCTEVRDLCIILQVSLLTSVHQTLVFTPMRQLIGESKVKHFNLTSIRRHHLEVFLIYFDHYCYASLVLNCSILSSTILHSDLQNYDCVFVRMGVKCWLQGGKTIFERRWGRYASDFHSCLLQPKLKRFLAFFFPHWMFSW